MLALTCAMVAVDTVFYAALTPLVPYFAEKFGLSKSSVSILSWAVGVGMLLKSAPSGYLAAHLGVRPTALTGLDSVSDASLLFGFADGAWELVVLRLAARFESTLLLGFGVHVARDASPGGAQGGR